MAISVAAPGLLAGSVALAGIPDPSNVECPSSFIQIVGHNGVVGDPVGQYCVTVRDFNNSPVVNSPVVIDFSRCDLQLCDDQLDPGVTVDCGAQTVRRQTDVNGVACFRVIGKRRPPSSCTSQPFPFAQVFVFDGTVFACQLTAPVYDLVNEGGAGVTGNDFSEWLHLFFDCGVYLSAIDYNGNQRVDADDFSRFVGVFFGGASASSCPLASKCP